MLILEKRIGLGAVRECYEHPTDKAKCVKVLLPHAGLSVFERELKNYTAVKDVLKDFVIPCEKELVETNKGPGMICDLITDDNGEISQMIFNYKKDAEVKEKLDAFAALLLTHKLFFYDFNSFSAFDKFFQELFCFSFRFIHTELHKCDCRKRIS